MVSSRSPLARRLHEADSRNSLGYRHLRSSRVLNKESTTGGFTASVIKAGSMGGVCGCNRASAISVFKREPLWSTLEAAKSRLENNRLVQEARRARVEWLENL